MSTPEAPLQNLPVQALAQCVALLQQQAQADGSPGPVLLDVREAVELQLARLELPGLPLRHIPLGDLRARLDELDPGQPVLALCHHGVRSLHALMLLQRAGFHQLFNISGGIDAWSRQIDPQVPRY